MNWIYAISSLWMVKIFDESLKLIFIQFINISPIKILHRVIHSYVCAGYTCDFCVCIYVLPNLYHRIRYIAMYAYVSNLSFSINISMHVDLCKLKYNFKAHP